MNVIMKRYSTCGRIAFDDFISACIKLRALTGKWNTSVRGYVHMHTKNPIVIRLLEFYYSSDMLHQIMAVI